jgi:hypothetical protein
MNFEDPEVLERLTGPDYVKYWKETFGFDYVTKPKEINTEVINNTKKQVLDVSPLALHCVESEFR